MLMQLFIIILGALIGGYVAKKIKLQPIIGYLLAGIVMKSFSVASSDEVDKLAELGSILLLFSIGLELSLSKFSGMINKIALISVMQISIVSLVVYFLLKLLGFDNNSSLILSLGFSLSSTAMVVKTLVDRGETETIHGKLMIGWLLVQDLAVIPMMIVLPVLVDWRQGSLLLVVLAMAKAFLIISVSIVLGKHIVPWLIHKVAIVNSRELMVLTSVALAIGTALGVSFFGISASLGAFIAGFVISESQENHAVFAETRPLRDLFVSLFFVTLGFYINFIDLYSNILQIILIVISVLIVKILFVGLIGYYFKFKGKTVVITAFGLSQVGEFSFMLFTMAGVFGLISSQTISIGIAVTLITLILTPLMYQLAIPVWRYLSKYLFFLNTNERNLKDLDEIRDHIIICGYGRVGGWVGKVLNMQSINFVVIDLDPRIVQECKDKGIMAIHGDPIEKEVLHMAGLSNAKAVIIAIPDRMSQESIVAHVQTISPNTKIISRVHLDEDYEKLKNLRVDKLVQPEFEAAISIIKSILVSMGRKKQEINNLIKSMRLSHAKI